MHVLRFIAPRLEAVATVRCGSPGSCLETDMQDYSCIHESSLGGSHFVVARHAVFQTCCQCLLLQEPCETHTCSHKKPGTAIPTGTKVSPATAFSPAFSLLPQCRTVRPAHACAHHFIHFLRSCRCYICWLVTDWCLSQIAISARPSCSDAGPAGLAATYVHKDKQEHGLLIHSRNNADVETTTPN